MKPRAEVTRGGKGVMRVLKELELQKGIAAARNLVLKQKKARRLA